MQKTYKGICLDQYADSTGLFYIQTHAKVDPTAEIYLYLYYTDPVYTNKPRYQISYDGTNWTEIETPYDTSDSDPYGSRARYKLQNPQTRDFIKVYIKAVGTNNFHPLTFAIVGAAAGGYIIGGNLSYLVSDTGILPSNGSTDWINGYFGDLFNNYILKYYLEPTIQFEPLYSVKRCYVNCNKYDCAGLFNAMFKNQSFLEDSFALNSSKFPAKHTYQIICGDMYSGCTSLQIYPMQKYQDLDTSSSARVNWFWGMFNNCTKLKYSTSQKTGYRQYILINCPYSPFGENTPINNVRYYTPNKVL